MTRPLPPEWQCIASPASDYGGHALEMGRAWDGSPTWRCINCFERIATVEVDALALMMDGTFATGDEIAEAILELEAWADWRPSPDADPATDPITTSTLADAALDEADARNPRLEWFDEMYLEAAALLRDGWRPGGES